jgi:allantoin racemase
VNVTEPHRRIAILPPIPVKDFERERRKAQYESFAGIDTEIDVRILRGGPELTDREYELFWSTGFMILEAEKAAREGASGIIIDCTGDPGIEQIAEAVDVPVVGALGAGVHFALQVGRKFSVLALDEHWARMIRSRLRDYGLEGQTASIETVGKHVYQPSRGRNMKADEADNFLLLLEAAGEKAVAAGADSVVLGSTTIIDGREELERKLGIPVIAPGIAALKTMEAMLDMGLRNSRRAFPAPAIRYGEVIEGLLRLR